MQTLVLSCASACSSLRCSSSALSDCCAVDADKRSQLAVNVFSCDVVSRSFWWRLSIVACCSVCWCVSVCRATFNCSCRRSCNTVSTSVATGVHSKHHHTVANYTVSQKKRATLFLILWLFLMDFYTFYTSRNRNEFSAKELTKFTTSL